MGWVMKLITFISAPHLGQTNGSISYTRRSSSAQRRRARLSSTVAVSAGADSLAASAPCSAFLRFPRETFE